MKAFRYISTIVLVFTAALPSVAAAHATPLDMTPHSGAMMQEAPSRVSIRFSERLESGSSLIRVFDESGARVDTGPVLVEGDGNTLTVAVHVPDGIYKVSWSVISKDDGHFTRGSFAFSVGSRPAPASTDEEVIQIASTKEATLIFIEFLGNSLLWGLLALFLITRDFRLKRVFSIIAIAAVCAASVGALGQLALKSYELAGLHGIGFVEALKMYLHTVAGYSTVIRMAALTACGVLGAVFGFKETKRTLILLGVPLLVFAYFRAIVSHATANPFHPAVSIAVNFVHVIEKDLWFGTLAVLCVILGTRMRETLASTLVPRVVSLLSANLAVLALSAGYIVWLHLQSFSNVTGSTWGSAFVPLLACAIALIALHSAIVGLIRLRPRFARQYIVPLISAETAAAMLVVFFSSVVIITSPPPHDAARVFSYRDGDTVISLSRSLYEDDSAMLSVSGSHETPVVSIGTGEDALQVTLTKRSAEEYVFPIVLFGSSTSALSVIVARPGAYDAQTVFNVSHKDFERPTGHGRTFDMFTISMIIIVAAGIGVAVFLRLVSRHDAALELRHAGPRILVAAIVSLVILLALVSALSRILTNPFKAACVADGNMWHIMQPTKAGVPLSGEAREGCMWGMGQYRYQFSDAGEYAYLGSLGPAAVTMETTPKAVHTNIPTDLTFVLKNADGTPATMLVDMEKYIHVVIVSKDESVFAHIHPDDNRQLTQYEIENSTFSVRYTFPKSGEYLVSVDYAHGTQLESRQFTMHVDGVPAQEKEVRTFSSPGVFDGYSVSMDSRDVRAGSVTTLQFTVSKDGTPVTTMQPYLSAVSHISVVKNDLSAFVHTHGEVHPPGAILPPVTVRDGKIIHSMAGMEAPAQFGPTFDAHVLFPSSGRYTIWAQINVGGTVIPTSFTLDVE